MCYIIFWEDTFSKVISCEITFDMLIIKYQSLKKVTMKWFLKRPAYHQSKVEEPKTKKKRL